MESQQATFREIAQKEENNEKQGKNSHQNGWHNRGSEGAKGGESMVHWTLEWHYKRRETANIKGDGVIKNHNRIIEKNLLKTPRK